MSEVVTEPRLTVADDTALAIVTAQTAREKEWYAAHPRFNTIADITGAVAAGQLVRIAGNSDVMPIYRLRAPGMETTKPPFLLPASAAALHTISRLWRDEVEVLGLDAPDIRIATTSLARTEEMQQALVESGALATPGSTHCVGAAFDLDASAYFRVDLEQGPVSVASPLRDRTGMQGIATFLQRTYQNNAQEMRLADSNAFDERVVTALMVVVQELHGQDYLNVAVEFPGTGNQCLHVCPNPELSSADWLDLAPMQQKSAWMG